MIATVAKGYSEARELRGLFEKQFRQSYWAKGMMVMMLGGRNITRTDNNPNNDGFL